MYFIEGLLCGLKQLNPKGGWLTHDPVRGWEIETPALHDEHCKILLQDDLTFVDGKVVEIEKYIEHYKKDIDKIVFHTWLLLASNVCPVSPCHRANVSIKNLLRQNFFLIANKIHSSVSMQEKGRTET